jgi:thioredoxin 1
MEAIVGGAPRNPWPHQGVYLECDGYDRSVRRDYMPTAVTQQTFEDEVVRSETPVLVGFWAEWCGPCHALTPILERIVEERNGELKLVKVNIDEERALAERYGVLAIPTTILFKGGEPSAVAHGAQPKGALERALGLTAEAA